ncbi:MAG TPA: PAS domain-containing protein [Candidatus Binatia bacterium]|nr:PAS domain-containing protein [Candidatus Binatia bacterium]
MTTRVRNAWRSLRARSTLSEPLVRKVLDSVDARVLLDPHGRIVLLNAAAERLFGKVWSELAGKSLDRLIPRLKAALANAPLRPEDTAEIASVSLNTAAGDRCSVQILLHSTLPRSRGGSPDLRVLSVRPIAA